MRIAVASAAPKSITAREPWPPTASASGRSAVSWLVMLALRVHEARCQNWRACVLARSWVDGDPLADPPPTERRRRPATIGWSEAIADRLKDSVAGQMALVPKPSAARW